MELNKLWGVKRRYGGERRNSLNEISRVTILWKKKMELAFG